MITKCPKSVKNGPHDYVKYAIVKGNKPQDMGEKVCYYDAMRSLGANELRLRPYNKDDVRAPGELYLAWMRMCQDNGLMPGDIEFYVEEGNNYLKIPGDVYDKHWMYAAMCCFRFADAFARMVWLVVENMNKGADEFTFWQALHYGLAAEYTYGAGHSFSYICKSNYSAAAYNNYVAKDDLACSVAIPLFFARSIKARKKVSGYTNTAISELATKIGGTRGQEVKIKGYSRPVTRQFPLLHIDRMDDLLTSRWTPMYRLEKPTKAKLSGLYKEAGGNGEASD